MLEIVPGPDFPTGGIICGNDGIIDGYKTGRGRITLRAKMSRRRDRRTAETSVVIEEIPYGIIRQTIVESVADA